MEHVIDLAIGGPDSLENVKPAHGLCNLKKPKAFKKIDTSVL
jgi:5-methylcytosine-specific restriction endonuclease McrA